MNFRIVAAVGLAALMITIGAGAALAADAAAVESGPPSRAVLGFERFLAASSPVCLNEPSARCVDMGWRFADADRNGTLSLAEVKASQSLSPGGTTH